MSASDIQHAEADGDTEPTGWDAVRDLPPSAKLVAKVLEYNDTLTQSQLADETLLPPRTVRYALNRLEDADVVDSRFSFADARKRIYSLRIE
ncbi:MarR family transcriptional regulator [Halomicroarcula sp. GCM10025817]|uniref:MarR family transcriptional regulator n=1 Tax=Halomicroarcula sp. GCM10025817 TaxID=3252672 RepID=UPI00360F3D38